MVPPFLRAGKRAPFGISPAVAKVVLGKNTERRDGSTRSLPLGVEYWNSALITPPKIHQGFETEK